MQHSILLLLLTACCVYSYALMMLHNTGTRHQVQPVKNVLNTHSDG